MMNATLFAAGLEPTEYIDGLRNYRSFVKQLAATAETFLDGGQPVSAALAGQVEALRTAVAVQGGRVVAGILTEDWCGDSACNLPLLRGLFSRAGVELRVFRGSDHAALKKMYNDRGTEHIPVVSLWRLPDGDAPATEIGCWIERPAACAARVDAWKAERPQFMELYRAKDDDKTAAREFATLYRQLLDTMAGWYQDDLWVETAKEIVAAATPAR